MEEGLPDKYNFIILDINCGANEVSKVSPPLPFLQKEYLEKLKSLLEEGGVIMLNLLCYDE